MSDPDSATPLRDTRLERLEEVVSFNDHALEQLNRQMVDLTRRVTLMGGKLEAIEARLAAMLEEPEDEAPPVPG